MPKIHDINFSTYPALASVLMRAFAKEPWNEVWTYDQAYRCIAENMKHSDSMGFYAVEDNCVVGGVFGRSQTYRELEFHISMIFVDPQYQGRGIARSMLASLDARLRELNVKGVDLCTVDYDRGFYEKCGFASLGEECLIMKKDL